MKRFSILFRLEALADYHKAVADVERLIGERMTPVDKPSATQKGGQQP